MKATFLLLLPLALVTAAAPAAAQDQAPPARTSAIQPGDVAPPLQIARWVKGEPVTAYEPGKVYLVEFWATWCGPCIANIPHLNALQRRFGPQGLVVIGMTNPDLRPDYTGPRHEGNSLKMVEDFVAARGSGMDYRVAYDVPTRETFTSLMGRRSGIPHAFLIGRDGRLVVDFHPTFLDDAVAAVMAGTWDPVAGPAGLLAAQKLFLRALNAVKFSTFTENYDELRRTAPSAAERHALLYFRHALKAGDPARLRDAVDELKRQAEHLGDVRELAGAARFAARELNTLVQSGVAGWLPAETRTTLIALLRDMAAFATARASSTEPAVFGAQAEIAAWEGDLPAAIQHQEKAVAVTLAGAKTEAAEKKRLDELKQQLALLERRRAVMQHNGYPE